MALLAEPRTATLDPMEPVPFKVRGIRDELEDTFTLEFSYIHGGSIRQAGSARYRQWLTHKLASWFDQFGTSGCVGCGRCITWCPVGIDLTAEVAAIRARDLRPAVPMDADGTEVNL